MTEENRKAIQDLGSVLHCYGCGRDNKNGLQIKSYITNKEGNEAISKFQPENFHSGGTKDIVYGGLIASLIDCHSCNLAIAYQYASEAREVGSNPHIHCVTAQLNITYKNPAPINSELVIKSLIRTHDGRKIWLDTQLIAKDVICAEAEVLAIRLKN